VRSSASPTRPLVAGSTRAVKSESCSARIVVSSLVASRVSIVTRGAATWKNTCESDPSSSSTSTVTSMRGSSVRLNAASSNASGLMPRITLPTP
jgi:hypothetical protein